MNKKNRLAGRFLPSRVYARWKWTVRFGLCALPLVLFLAGGLELYFLPNRYQSTTVFEYLGNRPLPEVEALLKSNNVIEQAVRATELSKRLEVDMNTAIDIISGTTETSVDPASGMIELKVANTRKELARDFAAELPKSLQAYEAALATQALNSSLEAAERTAADAVDEVEMKQQTLAKLISIRGEQPLDSVARLDVDAARADWEIARTRVVEGRKRVDGLKLELAAPRRWVAVHSEPQISQAPVGRKADESLGMVILQSLGIGLAFALAVPYLLELAFPRRRRSSAIRENYPEFSGVLEEI